MRIASRRARRLGGLLVLIGAVGWAFLRRRTGAVRWVEPPPSVPAGDGPGTPNDLPDDVLATDAGLTELPEQAPSGTVDDARVAELLAESADAEVVVLDETAYEQAVADAAPEPTSAAELPAPGPAADEPTDPELAARSGELAEATTAAEPVVAEQPGGVEETTESIRPDEEAVDEETGTGIAMPTFSEAPTMELPAVTDNLRAVRGIGPSMERKLHSLGIVSYRQLALLDGAELERVRAELTDFRNRIEREDWVGQARALHREKHGRDPS